MGLAQAEANALLNHLRSTAHHVQLHVGDPGAAGTANPAVETRRMEATFGAAAAGEIANTDVPTWTDVAATETFTFFSAWSASTGGAFRFSGTITGGAATAGQDASFGAGALTASLVFES